jgi:hypothetical protein
MPIQDRFGSPLPLRFGCSRHRDGLLPAVATASIPGMSPDHPAFIVTNIEVAAKSTSQERFGTLSWLRNYGGMRTKVKLCWGFAAVLLVLFAIDVSDFGGHCKYDTKKHLKPRLSA